MALACNSFVRPAIPKFDGYYEHWAILMENFMRSKEFWNLVEHGIPTIVIGVVLIDEQQKAIKDLTCKNLKAKNYFFLSSN